MAGAAGAAKNAAAWAEKRKAQVEAAVARKAQKEMGEVTSDHTFKPKLRSGKVSRSLSSIGSGSAKITATEKPSLISPVLKRRAGDAKETSAVEESPVPAMSEVKVREPAQVRSPRDAPGAAKKLATAAPKRKGRAPSPPSTSPRVSVSPARAANDDASKGAASVASAASAAKSKSTTANGRPTEKVKAVSAKSSVTKPAAKPAPEPRSSESPSCASPSPVESSGLCWKDMTNGLRHWHDPSFPTREAVTMPVCFPDGPAVFSSKDLPEEEPAEVQRKLPNAAMDRTSSRPEEENAHLKLERLRQQLEDEQRQLEEEAQQLRSGKLVDTEKLQQLAEKQQQRLARLDKEHERIEQSESAWVEDLSTMPLPVITEQPELLEEFQSQHLEEFERLQKQWQLEQVALQEKLQDQLKQFTPPAPPQPPVEEVKPADQLPVGAEEVQPAEESFTEAAPRVRKEVLEQFVVLQREQHEDDLAQRREQQQLAELIQQFKVKCEDLEARVKEPTSPSLFGVFKEYWTDATSGGNDNHWFASTAEKLAELIAPQETPDRTEDAAAGPAPQEKAASTRRWPPGPVR